MWSWDLNPKRAGVAGDWRVPGGFFTSVFHVEVGWYDVEDRPEEGFG